MNHEAKIRTRKKSEEIMKSLPCIVWGIRIKARSARREQSHYLNLQSVAVEWAPSYFVIITVSVFCVGLRARKNNNQGLFSSIWK
jgi:hypothetical protein